MRNDEYIVLEDIQTYSKELLDYLKNLNIEDEILKEIIIYFKASIYEIDNIKLFILEQESKINGLEQGITIV